MGKKVFLYSQLERVIREKIRTGEYQQGIPLPSERKLAEQYGVSRLTVRQAVAHLAEEGLLVKLPRKGTYLKAPRIKRVAHSLSSFSAMLRQQGILSRDKVVFAGKVPMGFRLSRIFGPGAPEECYRICRVRYGDGVPLAFEDSCLPYGLIPDIEAYHFENTSLYGLFANLGVRLHHGEQTLSAIRLPAYLADYLDLPPGSPAFRSCFINYSEDGRVVEYTVATHNPSKYVYQVL